MSPTRKARLGTVSLGKVEKAAVTVTAALVAVAMVSMGVGMDAGLAASGAAPTAPVGRSKIPASARQRLAKIAESQAAGNGDSHPTSVLAVATIHAAALRVVSLGDITPSISLDEPVYLVVMHGSFTGYEFSTLGSPPPAGSYLSIVVSRANFWVTDEGLARKPSRIKLSSLGRVYRLRLARPAPGRDRPRRLTS